MLGELVTAFVTSVVFVLCYFKWLYQYWSRQNVPYLQPAAPFGNIGASIRGRENAGVSVKNIYKEMKSRGWKYGGVYFFAAPRLMIVDLERLKAVMTRDFQHFTHRNTYANERDDPLSDNLVNLNGPKWRSMRAKLTPTFTSAKMKLMFRSVEECGEALLRRMAEESARGEPTDVKEVLACFTTDVIGSCAFGLNCHSIDSPDSPFRLHGRKVFNSSRYERLKVMFCEEWPRLATFLRLKVTADDVEEFFVRLVEDTLEAREAKGASRDDFMQLLVALKNDAVEPLSVEEVAAQSFVFFMAGFETSSTMMTFALYELARRQDIQQKVRDEIGVVLDRHGGKVTYESIQDMKYLGQVVDETLRKYPPAPFVHRKCVKNYRLDDDVVIEKDVKVIIPIYGVHHDEEYYPDPEKFDPERFSEENKTSRPNFAFIPFGEGPRMCIGVRFALMQSKVGLITLLKNYRFTVNGRTKEPLQLLADTLILTVDGDVWLDVEKI